MESSTRPHRTKREAFLMEMDGLIPWEACVRLMEPHWPGGARRTEQMLRMFLLQIWFHLPDDAVEDVICDSRAMMAFMKLDRAAGEQVPDAASLCEFRRTITVNGLQEKLFAIAQRPLEQAEKMVSSGTVANAALVENAHS